MFVAPVEGEEELVRHVLTDGFTWAAVTWYRGMEIRIGPSHPRWAEVQSWIYLTEFEQIARYKRVMFGHGPWPGLSYVDALRDQQHPLASLNKGSGQQVTLPGEDELRRAQEAEQSRRGAVPALAS